MSGTVLNGPPKPELVPVKNFLPGVLLDEDARYQSLCGPLAPEEIEFAKAMAVTSGNIARAVAMIFPDMTEVNQRKWGSRRAKQPPIVALINYLQSLEYHDDRPVTLDEFRREVNKRFRSAGKDTAAWLDIAKLAVQVNGLKLDGKQHGNEQLALAMQRADDVIHSLHAASMH